MSVPFTDRSRRIFALADEEARRLGHEYIGTEHILLGLVAEGSGVAALVLKDLGVDLKEIRLEIYQLVQTGPNKVSPRRLPMTPAAKRGIEYATHAARELNHEFVGSEHLLVGLLCEGESVATQVLKHRGVHFTEAMAELVNILGKEGPQYWAKKDHRFRGKQSLKVLVTTVIARCGWSGSPLVCC